MNMNQDKEAIKQELSEILAKYYDGSFARLVQDSSAFPASRKKKGKLGGSCEANDKKIETLLF